MAITDRRTAADKITEAAEISRDVPDLRSLSREELSGALTSAGFPAFRAGQVYRWLHVQLVRDVDEMSNLPKDLITFLKEQYRLSSLKTAEHQVSRIDGTQKFLFELADGETVESVYMKYHYGSSVCVSSQVGCRMGCRFCASTIGGLARNLLPGEMLEEVYAIQRSLMEEHSALAAGRVSAVEGLSAREEPAADCTGANRNQSAAGQCGEQGNRGAAERKDPGLVRGAAGRKDPAGKTDREAERISHVVIMGTGEPLDNYENVVKFLRMLTDGNGRNLSARNVTLSTCGIVPRIYDLAREGLPVTLALSLHAPTDEKRRQIMPIANRYPLSECMEACRFYARATGRRVTFEYSLIRGVNDTAEDAQLLAVQARRCGAHVNLIPVNPVTESGCEQPDAACVRAFQTKLEKRGINVSIRRALGRDIDGACGQLRHRHASGRS